MRIDGQTSALLVIDIQKDFCEPDLAYGKSGRDVSPIRTMVEGRLVPFLRRSHAASLHTVYVMANYPIGKFSADGFTELCVEGSIGAQLFLVQPDTKYPTNRFLTKSELDAFTNPQLHEYLHQKGVQQVLFAGVTTDKCVRATVLGARSLGYRAIILSDLVAAAAHRRREHQQVLEMFSAQPGVEVIPSGEIEFSEAPSLIGQATRRDG